MKKVILLFSLLMFFLIISSCTHNPMAEIENVTWKSDKFDIIANQQQLLYPLEPDDEGNFASVTLNNKTYSCNVYTYNNVFSVGLLDENYNRIDIYDNYIQMNEGAEPILAGSITKKGKVRNKDYVYSFEVTLKKTGQYYNYCIDNSIEFPETITFYAYENK